MNLSEDYSQLPDTEVITMLVNIRRSYFGQNDNDRQLALYSLKRLNQADRLKPVLYKLAGWSDEEITEALAHQH